MEHKPAGWAGGIDVLSEGPEPCTTRLDQIDNLKQVFQAAGKAVVFGV
jgi:hypothetical protein